MIPTPSHHDPNLGHNLKLRTTGIDDVANKEIHWLILAVTEIQMVLIRDGLGQNRWDDFTWCGSTLFGDVEHW